MGATGTQVVWSVVLEAFVVGLVASAIGLVAGIFLGIGLLALLRGIGLDLPDTSTVLLGAHGRRVAARGCRRHGGGGGPACGARRAGAADRGDQRDPAPPPRRPAVAARRRHHRHRPGRRGARLRRRPRRSHSRARRPGAGRRARRLHRARGRRDPARDGRAPARTCHRPSVGSPAGRHRLARAGECDARPAPHRDHRVGTRDRARARRAHRDLRRVGARVGARGHGPGARSPTTSCAPTGSRGSRPRSPTAWPRSRSLLRSFRSGSTARASAGRSKRWAPRIQRASTRSSTSTTSAVARRMTAA